MEAEALFPKGAIFDTWDVNYFAADEGKSLICRIKIMKMKIKIIKAEMILLCMYVVFHVTYFQTSLDVNLMLSSNLKR